MVAQHCFCSDGELESMSLSANAEAMRLLAEMGRMEIIQEHGRRVIGKFKLKE